MCHRWLNVKQIANFLKHFLENTTVNFSQASVFHALCSSSVDGNGGTQTLSSIKLQQEISMGVESRDPRAMLPGTCLFHVQMTRSVNCADSFVLTDEVFPHHWRPFCDTEKHTSTQQPEHAAGYNLPSRLKLSELIFPTGISFNCDLNVIWIIKD
jgi:hypothetical protein